MTTWTIAHQASLSMEFFRQEYSSGLPFPSLGDLPNPGVKAGSTALQADSLLSEPPGRPSEMESIVESAKMSKGHLIHLIGYSDCYCQIAELSLCGEREIPA